jgi:ABC-2 type transport system permease protein/lipopolysaccharide transport system permease protein
MQELWRSRELLWTLAERDLRVRYKQAVLGAAWAVITPLALMLVFSLFLQRVARFDTEGMPYPLFSYLGLLPWAFFSSSVSSGGSSLVSNNSLLNKVYCPREVFPLAAIIVAGVDTLVSGIVLALLFIVTGTAPRATSFWVLPLFTIQLVFTVGIALFVSAALVYVRDLRQAIPIALQLGLFATPVAYGIDVIPARYHVLYSTLNPLAPVIDGYRRAVLFGQAPSWDLVLPGAATAVVVLVAGYATFKKLETWFADVA